MGKALVIVESPTKAKTISRFLPKNFKVEACVGHVRDLPQSASDIPLKLKKEEWTKIGVNVKEDFEPLYVIPKGKSKVIQKLKAELSKADELYLATDEDREGESISWHLVEILKPKVPTKRMVFHEITKKAIEEALKKTRKIDQNLVKAQETRRILDRLVGYTLSPLIWKKIAYGLSAGRVQSVAVRVLVQRERERLKFKKADYWGLGAKLEHQNGTFESRLLSVDGKRVAIGKDFDESTGQLLDSSKVLLLDEAKTKTIQAQLKKEKWSVVSVEERPTVARPPIPFTTSTFQQEMSRKLGLSARDSMRVAQRLYENGLITYMRTDSPFLSEEALQGARESIVSLFGRKFMTAEPRRFAAKSKGAQEAHEAIRPAGAEFVNPKDTGLSGKELAVYELIWKRTLASQMVDAQKLSTSVRIEAGSNEFACSGTRITFPGFLRVYVEGSDDPESALDDRESLLPEMKTGDTLKVLEMDPTAHETKPPARFTEASLIQFLEKEGVGRPSTYASIIGTIIEREYVRKQGPALVPTFTAFAVTQLLEKNFDELVDTGFTSEMEKALDDIADGELEALPYLKKFYLGANGLAKRVADREKKIDPDESRTVQIPIGKDFGVKVGRFGAYVVKDVGKKAEPLSASIPVDVSPSELNPELVERLIQVQKDGPQSIGKDPATGEKIYALIGRFGPYVQLGQVTDDNPKPRRASIPKGVQPELVTLEMALKYLSLPRTLGNHPETGKPVSANVGRFGPYVAHNGEFRSLKKSAGDDVYAVTLERALEIFALPKLKKGESSKLLKELGKHPKSKKKLELYYGRFGAFLKYKDENFPVPKEVKFQDLTLDQAVKLVDSK